MKGSSAFLFFNQAFLSKGVAGMEHWEGVLSFYTVLYLIVWMYLNDVFYQSLIKRPIMDGFQMLRYLWKHLDKTLQYIMLKILKSQNLTKKRPFKVFENHFYQLLDSILHYLEAKFYHDYFINLDHFDKK